MEQAEAANVRCRPGTRSSGPASDATLTHLGAPDAGKKQRQRGVDFIRNLIDIVNDRYHATACVFPAKSRGCWVQPKASRRAPAAGRQALRASLGASRTRPASSGRHLPTSQPRALAPPHHRHCIQAGSDERGNQHVRLTGGMAPLVLFLAPARDGAEDGRRRWMERATVARLDGSC